MKHGRGWTRVSGRMAWSFSKCWESNLQGILMHFDHRCSIVQLLFSELELQKINLQKQESLEGGKTLKVSE
jgi:hypothetical protein